MPEIFVLYIFLVMMVLNLLGSFVYLVGFDQFRAWLGKSLREYLQKTR